jgi:gamma-glutamylcyclotransferase (GGCT)/AIG2-like uncharacterized protein YtfP
LIPIRLGHAAFDLMSQYVFAYGTLQPGLAPREIAPVVETLRPIGEGFAFGRLYDLGEYPAAVLDATSSQRVFGTVFELPDDSNVLRQLDAYEGFIPEMPDQSLFVRNAERVILDSGSVLTCWVYAFNGVLDPERIIASGRYVKWPLA